MITNSKRRVKRRNEIRIYQLLHSNQAMSRKRIAEILDLTPASITQLTGGMIEAGLLKEVGTLTGHKVKAGPREMLLDINEEYRYLIGVDIEMDMVSVGLVTLKGRALYRRSFKVDLGELQAGSADKLITQIVSCVHTLLKKASLTQSDIIYCGIGMVGREYYYLSRGLKIPPLLEAKTYLIEGLATKLGVPIAFENNVRALASAEANFYPQAEASFLFVKVGPGIGSAIVLNQQLYQGERRQAGEIGSAIVNECYPEVARSMGATVYLEDIFSLPFVKNELAELWPTDQLPSELKSFATEISELTITDIYKLLEAQQPQVTSIYEKKMRILAERLTDYTTLLDLQRVYLYFGADVPLQLFKMLDKNLPEAFRRAKRELQLSHIDKQRAFIGGAGVAYSETIALLESLDQDLSQLN
ncbi:ROK family protein [Lacticaseibacillus sp. GG6-2]